MKNLIFIIIAFFSLIGSQNLKAQSFKHQKHQHQENYVVLTRKVPQLKPIIHAAKELAKEDAQNFGEFHVVICGKTIKETKDHELMNSYIEMAQKNKVKIFACGFSMKKFGVKASELPKGMEIVENGILYNFKLQKQGYRSITL